VFPPYLLDESLCVQVENTDSQATSSFYNSLSVAYLSEIAMALGRSDEAVKYAVQFDSMTAAYYGTCKSCAVWASCCGAELGNHTSQTASIMALALNMAAPPLSKTGGPIPAHLVQAVAANLVKAINSASNHTTSGIIGATFVFDVLVAHNYGALALDMLLKDDQPSFGYMISQGATTLCVLRSLF
jgi:alpha-L-rhamnosidase